MKDEDMQRVSMRLPKWLNEYYDERVKVTGAPKSILMLLDLESLVKGRSYMDTLEKISNHKEDEK